MSVLIQNFFWIFQGFKEEIPKSFKKRRQNSESERDGRIWREMGKSIVKFPRGGGISMPKVGGMQIFWNNPAIRQLHHSHNVLNKEFSDFFFCTQTQRSG